MIKTILFVLAVIFFCLDAFHVQVPQVSWTPLAFATLTVAVFLI